MFQRLAMRLAILGATGSVGQAVAVNLLRSRLLRPGDHIELVGRDTEDAQRRLLGLSIDLADAFDDLHVPISISTGLDAVQADIVVVAAGETLSSVTATRHALAAANAPLFEAIGLACARRLPDALFIVVSNPVEHAVATLSRYIERHRVIGMGAQQDSLRFARAIAVSLGLSRHEVEAMVLGEHGAAMVPLWSRVRLAEAVASRPDLLAALAALQARAASMPLAARVASLRDTVSGRCDAGRAGEAHALVQQALPDERIFVEPFLTTWCVHSTAQATANATLQMVAAASGRRAPPLCGQVMLAGEAFGLHGVCGLPVTLRRDGWVLDRPDRFDADEQALVRASAAAISAFLAEALAKK